MSKELGEIRVTEGDRAYLVLIPEVYRWKQLVCFRGFLSAPEISSCRGYEIKSEREREREGEKERVRES